jgi:hypothetical protein
MGTLNIDRYHATMGDASYKEATRLHDKPLSEAEATFYVTQRKLPLRPASATNAWRDCSSIAASTARACAF